MTDRLAWGLLATGNIAKTFAKGLAHSKTGKLVAVGSRTQTAAEAFGAEFNVPHRHGSYAALLADPAVQAVYISTPHPLHAEWAIKAAEAGKHILCEKPLALNHADAMAMVEAAHRHGVFLMEAFMYRCHPQTAKLVELIREKALGEVRVIQASFGFHAGYNLEGRLYQNALGGGGILDVGCYPVSMARLLAGAATGKPCAEPIHVKAAGVVGERSRVDEYAVATLQFPGGILAELSTGIAVSLENVVRVFGTEGRLEVHTPWIPCREGGTTRILLCRKGEKEPREIPVESSSWLWSLEADVVAEHLEKGQAPAMNWADSLGNMQTLDRWREGIGMLYDAERNEAQVLPVHKRPLAVRPKHSMKYGRIPGLDKQVSRLVLGCDYQTTITNTSVMHDDFFEQGGNCFDTAYGYGGGKSERMLGQWIKNRGLRQLVVILGKGAHTPYCNPADLSRQLHESLARLQTDYIDMYMMHRDNLEIPVGEFADVLNEHQRAGRIRAYGGSNWSIERVEAFNAYAKAKGHSGFVAVSNNFSLARMVDPVWAGCISASDPASRAWFEKTQMTLMPWSSQARGFFTERAGPDKKEDEELVRCWYSEDNFRRRERVLEMAARRNVLPIQLALACVLCQPFPTFPLIGPRLLAETRTSLPALGLELSPAELKWLNLEA